MRGEKRNGASKKAGKAGSPPHARGKASHHTDCSGVSGITPACAGKRHLLRLLHPEIWDHPRMRGEKSYRLRRSGAKQGSPPHARGKVPGKRYRALRYRITPACAGKSHPSHLYLAGRGDHPRMRGEKPFQKGAWCNDRGSPPHARGKAYSSFFILSAIRITPACAGKRIEIRFSDGRVWDHPRMRGEKFFHVFISPIGGGSPPHARGKESNRGLSTARWGITPACAGKSCPYTTQQQEDGDHPRMRGEKYRYRN